MTTPLMGRWWLVKGHVQKNSKNILSLGTLRGDKIGGCPIDSDKILQEQGRGTYDYKAEKEKDVIIIKWVDNKCVLLGGTAYGVEPTVL
ncbi:hypothetical protein JTB14_036713 [Gonioctena quinquepunctata]|nr:hypothetical protein JTB14_036713 [Gonioctena quinquepunctata]